MVAVGVGVLAFALMEPFTYAAHRWVMHGVGWGWHRAHHQAGADSPNTNDLFPVVFAAVTVLAMAVATFVPAVHPLLAAGAGVTAYGATYAFVHDVYIHRRLGRVPAWAPLDHLARAHALHHADGGEPYGMLLPLVPGHRRRALPAATPPAPASRAS